jgi:hypothetical protein
MMTRQTKRMEKNKRRGNKGINGIKVNMTDTQNYDTKTRCTVMTRRWNIWRPDCSLTYQSHEKPGPADKLTPHAFDF